MLAFGSTYLGQTMQPERETQATEISTGWADKDGFIGPYRPGMGPRSDPRGTFPTGPNIGSKMPNIVCKTSDNLDFDLHAQQTGQPAVFIFFRSAVW